MRAAKVSRSASCQWVCGIAATATVGCSIGRIEPHAPFDLAVVEHDAAGRNLHGGAARLAVDQEHRAGIGEAIKRVIEHDRPVALALRDREQARLGRRPWMGVIPAPADQNRAPNCAVRWT